MESNIAMGFKMLMKRALFISLLLLFSPLVATAPQLTEATLAATPEHKRATELISQYLSNYHYKKTLLDNSLSTAILDQYLEELDPNKSFFLQADINAFSIYRQRLDDAILDAELEPAFAIFNVFKTRLDERIELAKRLLGQNTDFDVDENYVLDRSKLPWAANTAELDEIWRKRVKNDVLSLRLTGQPMDKIRETLIKRYEGLARHTHQFSADDVYQLFINAYTTSVEPHTAYFSPRASEDFRIRMSLSLEGIGAVLRNENEYTVVQQVVPGGPADKSGQLHSEDRITSIGEGPSGTMTDVVGWRLENVVGLIRGPKGSRVRLQVLPKGTLPGGATATITLTRDTIQLEEQAAKKSMIEFPSDKGKTRIGVIELPAFYMDFASRARGDPNYRSTTRDVRRLVSELKQEGVSGIIMDLRGNGGGSLSEATDLTGLFIETGPIVQVKDASGRIDVERDPDPNIAYSGPLAVLVDRQSASASEIYAGAIQDYHRGIIVGEPTYGKGTVQNLVDLDSVDDEDNGKLGQLKATIAQFFRVSGSSTQHRGVIPDIPFPNELHSINQGESEMKNALPWAEIKPANFVPAKISTQAILETRSRHEHRIKGDPVFKLLLAEAQSLREIEQSNRVSLLEKQRRAEWDAADQLRRERERRSQVIRQHQTPSGADATQNPSSNKDLQPGDVLLNEAANILRDFITLTQRAPGTLEAKKPSEIAGR
jgi:carboxyl-terminal processing protease